MGRKKTPVNDLFTLVERDGMKAKRAVCKYCLKDTANNGSRKMDHVKKCIKVPDEVKFDKLQLQHRDQEPKQSKARPSRPSQIINIDLSDQELDSEELAHRDDSGAAEGSVERSDSTSEPVNISHSNDIVHSTPIKKMAPLFLMNTSRPSSAMSGQSISGTTKNTHRNRSYSKLQAPEPKRQNNLTSSISFDRLSPEQNETIDHHLAKAIFASGTPLSIVENPYWMKLFSVLRPAYKLPSRHHLTEDLLEQEYNRIQRKCEEHVRQTNSVGLLCDGWTNIRNESIINFVVTTPEPMFWKSLPTGSDSHTGEYIAEEISKVIKDIGPPKVGAVCTDNASNMKKAWVILEEKYPHLTCYGCLAHGLNLIFSDILKLNSVSKLLSECSSVVKCIKSSHVLQAKLVEKQTANKVSETLKLYVKTRWGSVVQCFKSLIVNKLSLRQLAIDDGEAIQKALTKQKSRILLDEVFWDKIEGIHKLLAPVAGVLITLETDKPIISSAIKFLKEIKESISVNVKSSPLLQAEEKAVLDIIEKRRSFCIQPIHLTANLLDPRYNGMHLEPEEHVEALEKIYNISKKMLDVDANKVMGEVTSYCRKNNFFAKEVLWAAAAEIEQHEYDNSPSDWWAVYCRHQELSKVAIRILEMPATSAACERSFSQHGSIHSKKRNRQTNKHVEKLLYISHNLKLTEHEFETKITRREPRDSSHKGASESTSLSNFVPAAEVPMLSVSAQTASTTSTSVSNAKKRKSNEGEESDSECSDSEESFLIPYDDSSDASLESILGNSREKDY